MAKNEDLKAAKEENENLYSVEFGQTDKVGEQALFVKPSTEFQKKKKRNKMKTIDTIFVISMLALPITYFLIFWLYANLQSFAMAFQLPTGEWDPEFTAWKEVWAEFADTGNERESMWLALRNTGLYFIKDLIFLPFHVIVAYFLFRRVPGYRIYQVVLYIPAMISGVVYVTAFKEFLGSDGPIGTFIREGMGVPGWIGECFSKIFNGEEPEFFGNPTYATPTIMFYTIWLGWAGNMLLLGGAMARIPVEVLESGRLDGVNTFQEIFILVFPLLWNTLSTFIILQMTGIFNASGPIYLFIGNASDTKETLTLGYWIFREIKFGNGESAYNKVSAMGLLMTTVGVPVILLLRKLIEKIPTVDY